MNYSDPRVVATPQEVQEHLTVEQVGNKHEALIVALADLIWPVIRERTEEIIDLHLDNIRERINSAIDARIDAKLNDDLNARIESTVDDKVEDSVAHYLKYSYDIDQEISSYLSNHFDIRDYDVIELIDEHLSDRLEDMVTESVSNLTFEVNVSR